MNEREAAERLGLDAEGLSLAGRMHNVRNRKAFAGTQEEVIATAYPFPSADLYLSPGGDAALIGATLRLYIVAGEVRLLARSAVILSSATPIRLGANGRGGTRWEATIQLPGAGPQTAQHPFMLCAHDGNGTAYDLACSRNLRPGDDPTYPNAYGQAAVPSAVAGVRLQAIWGTNNGAAACWFMVFDSAAAPNVGDTPIARAYVAVGQSFAIGYTDPADVPPSGRIMSAGISWATTAAAVTYAAGSGQNFDVTTKLV